MNLASFIQSGQDPVPLGLLGTMKELVVDIQGRLAGLGLLDPPADGSFGPVSHWAFQAFCSASQIADPEVLTAKTAKALLSAKNLFPLDDSGDTFEARVCLAMRKANHWIARHPDCVNIVYVEGCDPDGTANQNVPNAFNDVRLVIRVVDGLPRLEGAWQATTEPGRAYTMNPESPAGAARIAFGQYKAWSVGQHPRNSPKSHEALVQVGEITVYRDNKKIFERYGQPYTGLFGINQHWGYNYAPDDIRNASAGCLVGRLTKEHERFMAIVKKDARYLSSSGYRFVTTVMPAKLVTAKS